MIIIITYILLGHFIFEIGVIVGKFIAYKRVEKYAEKILSKRKEDKGDDLWRVISKWKL